MKKKKFNKNQNIVVKHPVSGKKISLLALAQECNVSVDKVVNRYLNGKRGMELVKTDKDRPILLWNGRRFYTLKDVSAKYGLHYQTLVHRYNKGFRFPQIVYSKKLFKEFLSENRQNITTTINGQAKTLKELSVDYGISLSVLKNRYRKGMREKDLIKPEIQTDLINYQSESPLIRLSKETGIKYITLNKRYHQGLRGKELVEPPKTHMATKIPFKGREVTYKELSQEYGIKPATLFYRYQQGDRDDKLVRKVNSK